MTVVLIFALQIMLIAVATLSTVFAIVLIIALIIDLFS